MPATSLIHLGDRGSGRLSIISLFLQHNSTSIDGHGAYDKQSRFDVPTLDGRPHGKLHTRPHVRVATPLRAGGGGVRSSGSCTSGRPPLIQHSLASVAKHGDFQTYVLIPAGNVLLNRKEEIKKRKEMTNLGE
jgi:hypothetical protein